MWEENAYRFLVGKSDGEQNFRYLGIGKIILKLILKRWSGRARNGSMWSMIGASGGHM